MSINYCCYGMYADVGHSDDCPSRKPTNPQAQAAAPAVGVNLRNAYARDLEDTLNQIADALGVERGKPEALITAALSAQPAQPEQPAQEQQR